MKKIFINNFKDQRKDGQFWHHEAMRLLESGFFLKALLACDQALFFYHQDKNLSKMSHIFALKQNIFKHLVYEHLAFGHSKCEDLDLDCKTIQSLRIVQHHSALQAVEIARLSSDEESILICELSLAHCYLDLGKYQQAVNYYQKCLQYLDRTSKIPINMQNIHIKNIKNTHINSLFFKANIISHLSFAQCKLENKPALIDLLSSLMIMIELNANSLQHKVWISGGCLKIAELLMDKKSLLTAFDKNLIDKAIKKTILILEKESFNSTAQNYTVQNSTAQKSTAQKGAVQNSTAQKSALISVDWQMMRKASDFLGLAKKIVASDDQLVLRARQLKILQGKSSC